MNPIRAQSEPKTVITRLTGDWAGIEKTINLTGDLVFSTNNVVYTITY